MTKITAKSSGFLSRCAICALGAVLALGIPRVRAHSIPEPATVFYGKVWDISSLPGRQLTEGDLTWVIRRADGINQILRTKLFPQNNGEYSYRLNVPHDVLALGLEASTGSVPLRALEDRHAHLIIAVNQQTAQILGPSGSTFDAAQARRAASYRLDLAVAPAASDSDGNGLPQWWKLKYRLTDPNGDPDGDGRNNLAEFLNGSDPTRDDRTPSLETRETRVYAGGISIVRLQSNDADSAPTNLIYTLRSLPEGGAFYLRNATAGGSNHDLLLGEAASFSQADVNSGRVIFVHKGPDATASTSFDITLHDENPAHAISTNRIAVSVYKPSPEVSVSAIMPPGTGLPMRLPQVPGVSAEEQPCVGSYLLSKELGYIIGDASGEPRNLEIAVPSSALTRAQYDTQYVPDYGADRQHVLIGSFGADRIVGGMENDILVGGGGNDTLRGNGGSDLFVFASRTDGNDTIEDFNPAESDGIDLSRVLTGTSTLLTDYVQISSASGNSSIHINFNGTGTTYNDMVINLPGTAFTQESLYDLVDGGNLITGDKLMPARISIVATVPTASENGPVSGEFTLARGGAIQFPLNVNLLITGSSANGVDYQYLPSQASFATGQRNLTVPIRPYVDAATELAETVQISIAAGTGYLVGTSSSAQVTILDLMPVVSIEALERTAVKADQTPGLFAINRTSVLDRSVLVRFTISGTASNGVDYVRLSSFINLQVGQTTGLIEVTPTASAALQTAKSVQLTIRPDSTYLIGEPQSARVVLVDQRMTFVQWRERFFPSSTGSIESFAAQDPGRFGIPSFQRYAFGLDPNAPDRARLPKAVLRDGYLTMDVWRQPSATDVEYVAGVSVNLSSWTSSSDNVQSITAAEHATNPNVISYRALPATKDSQQLFMRLRVVYRP